MFAKMLLSFGISLGLTLLMIPAAIPVLKKLKFGQSIRKDGPQSHLAKEGTPNMGGIFFILASLIAALIVEPKAFASIDFWIVVLAFVGYGLIGFIDDFLIDIRHNNDGLKAKYKFALQLLLAVIFYLIYRHVTNSYIIIPFFNVSFDMGWFYIVVVVVMFTAESNAVNLSDGLDGLCAGLVIEALAPFIYFCFRIQEYDLAVLIMGVIGALFGYLRYNYHPAKIFMGDTGSLALGGLLAAVAMVTKEEIALILIGMVFVIEVISVIIQVVYFHITKGKRFFRMAPIHHHFELGGMKETHVVWMFWGFGALFSIMGFVMGAMM